MFLMQENSRGLQSHNGFSRQLAIDTPKKARKVRDFYETGTSLGAHIGFIMLPISKARSYIKKQKQMRHTYKLIEATIPMAARE